MTSRFFGESRLGGGVSIPSPGHAAVLALEPDGDDLYVGGYFTEAGGGVEANHVARWNGAWSALGSGMNDRVRALALFEGGVVAGGDFTEAGGAPAAHVARWDGNAWASLGAGTDAPVHALCVHEGILFAGGDFTEAGGVPAAFVAAWDGEAWSGVGEGANSVVRAIGSRAAGLVIGGGFTEAGGVPAGHLALWDGAAWSAFGSGLDGTVHSLLSNDTLLYAGGGFEHAGGKVSLHLGRWTDPLAPTAVSEPVPLLAPILMSEPNPFNPATRIRFRLARSDRVSLGVYDIRGRMVRRLVDGVCEEGVHELEWRGRTDRGDVLPSGVYFLRLASDGAIATRKMIVIR